MFTAEGAVPLVGRHLEERRRRQHTGRVDEDVEPTVASEDVCDQLLGSIDEGEIRGVGRGRGPETLYRRLQLAVREVDARHVGSRVDECPGTSKADAPLGARDERDAPVEPPRPGRDVGVHTHRSAMTVSISTGMSNGRCGTPTDVRAPRQSAP